MAVLDIKAETPGTVWEIVARPGDDLAAGDEILVIESMKMEIPVGAARPGKLIDILVAQGDDVAEGQTVARIDVL